MLIHTLEISCYCQMVALDSLILVKWVDSFPFYLWSASFLCCWKEGLLILSLDMFVGELLATAPKLYFLKRFERDDLLDIACDPDDRARF